MSAPLALFQGIGFPEILILLLIVVLIFGARRLPELGRGLGEGIRGFRSAMKGDEPQQGEGEHPKDTPR
ncbi:MAG: twin-arginine translocase TatA/TatE family subunit [Acidobacteria bacterium]|nr:twin-arginine translocase TatA/TatE family subunit [Acidobacteriota bacterium]